MDVLEFRDIVLSTKTKKVGALKLSPQGIAWDAQGSAARLKIAVADITSLQWIPAINMLKVAIKDKVAAKFIGFDKGVQDTLSKYVVENMKKELLQVDISTKGWNWGEFEFTGNMLNFKVDSRPAFEVPLSQVAQSVIQGKNEVSLEFLQDDTAEPEEDQLVEMRVYIPPGMEDGEPAVDKFNKAIIERADIGINVANCIASFQNLLFSTPRGKYDIEMYVSFFKLHGKTFSYKILYSSISRMFLLEGADRTHYLLVINLDPPIRQGKTSHENLLLVFQKDEKMGIEINLDKATLEGKYAGKLAANMEGPNYDVVSRVFRGLTGKKVGVPGDSFKSKQNEGVACVRCSYKANAGHLYMLEKSFFFVKKPALYIRHQDIVHVEFSRVSESITGNTFDLNIQVRSEKEPHVFTGIDRGEYVGMLQFLQDKKLTVLGGVNPASLKSTARGRAVGVTDYSEDPYLPQLDADGEHGDGGGGEDSEEDEDYVGGKEEASDDDIKSDEEDGDDSENDDDDELASGDEMVAGTAELEETKAPARKKPSKKRKKEASDAENDDEDKPAAKKGKKKGPKKAASAYNFFSAKLRQEMKVSNPDMSFADLSKTIAQKWRELSKEEKEPFEEMRLKDKERYLADKEQYDKDHPDEEDDDKPAARKRKKKTKAAGEPTKPMSAYLLYAKDERPKLMAAQPELKFGDTGKLLGEKWKALSTEEKAPYLDRYAQEKEKYEEAIKKFREEHPDTGDAAESGEESGGEKKKKKKKKDKDKDVEDGGDGEKKKKKKKKDKHKDGDDGDGEKKKKKKKKNKDKEKGDDGDGEKKKKKKHKDKEKNKDDGDKKKKVKDADAVKPEPMEVDGADSKAESDAQVKSEPDSME